MEKVQEFQERVLQIKRGRKGIDAGVPCYWENTKKFENMERLTHVFDSIGISKVPIYTRYESNDRLVPLVENDYILKVFFEPNFSCTGPDIRYNLGLGVSLLRIKEIDKYSNGALVDLVFRKSPDSTEWVQNSLVDFPTKEAENVIIEKLYNVIEGFCK